MNTPLVLGLSPTGSLPPLEQVGGKGWSLCRMAAADLPVPPGFVLPVAFFEAWMKELSLSSAWSALQAAQDESQVVSACKALVELAQTTLALDPLRAEALAAAEAAVPGDGVRLYAVRSSSPEEDLAGASFAGGYTTVLGVTPPGLEEAVRRAFASCLDPRVAIYKLAQGFDARSPSIAIVVQRQIASEIAGVAFSLDPVSNAYDDAVINANWGLGETVVSGTASPDLYVVDRITGRCKRKELGSKEHSLWLLPDGGTEERPNPLPEVAAEARWTLDDEGIAAVNRVVNAVEALYERPVDIEWAFAKNSLYLLQARPITTHLALPDELLTAPGAPMRLYWDVTISVQGVFHPMSAFATSVWDRLLSRVARHVFGRHAADPRVLPVLATHGRLIVVLSNILTILDRDKITPMLARNIDAMAAGALDAVNIEHYLEPGGGLKRARWRLPWVALPKLWHVFMALRAPARVRAQIEEVVARTLAEFEALHSADMSTIVQRVFPLLMNAMFIEVLPRFLAARLATGSALKICDGAPAHILSGLMRLDQALPHNVTVEMGKALEGISRLVPAEWDAQTLVTALETGDAAPELKAAWSAFLGAYGRRGPEEIDPRSPRYREQPGMLLGQVIQLRDTPLELAPIAMHDTNAAARREAIEAAAGWLRGRRRRRFLRLARVVEELGGFREMPKYLLVSMLDLMRTAALREGARLVAQGRLDRVEDVFDLHLSDLENEADLRTARARRLAPIASLQRFHELPRIFDSRGRIFRAPPPELREGELSGQPVSAGVVTGRVKVLASPDEKALLRGEILVARATDPGWTPLFVNAAAVVLEVGGLLQHGSLVAREYGRPCVAGVQGATARLADGDLVEVDGNTGRVRILELASASGLAQAGDLPEQS